MLSNSNDRLVARDTSLPGLKLLLDVEAFATAWHVDRAMRRQPTAAIQYVRYKPGRRCVVMYLIATDRGEYRVIATAHNCDSWRKHCRTRDDRTTATNPKDDDAFAQSFISVAIFPQDRKLRLLEEMSTPSLAKKFVRSFVRKQIDEGTFRANCIAYKPGRRAVFDVLAAADRRYALKFFEASTFRKANDCAIAWDHCKGHLASRGVMIPELVRNDAKRRIMVTRWLSGENLASELSTRDLDDDVFKRVGAALAKLHDSDPRGLPDTDPTDQRLDLSRLANDVAMLVPRLSGSAKNCAARLRQELGDLPPIRIPIHGDFYAKQVCIADRSVGIMDFDQSTYGDPLRDVGNFIAKLIWNAHRGDFDTRHVYAIEQAFLDGYVGIYGPIDQTSLDLQVAVGLFKCVSHPFRSGLKDWEKHVQQILNLVSTRLGRHRPLANATAFPAQFSEQNEEQSYLKQRIWRDEQQPWLADALIATRSRQRILRSCPTLSEFADRLEVERVQPIRYKAGRRCLIRYDLRISQSQAPDETFSILGKLRFKGMDRHGYAVQQQLHDFGFNHTNPDGVEVPRPLGNDPATRIWFQECVEGQSIEQLAASSEEEIVANTQQRIAMALTSLHHAKISLPLKTYTIGDEAQTLIERLGTVAAQQPVHNSALRELMFSVMQVANRVSRQPPTFIHRDFHPGQILLTSERTYLLDFDSNCRGPQTLDAGNFLAHLWELAIRDPDNADWWHRSASDFTDGYQRSISPCLTSHTDLDAWSWLAFARHIWISTRIPERRRTTADIIDAVYRRQRELC